VDDQPRREIEDGAGKWELLWARIPEGLDPLVHHCIGEQPTDHTCFSLHRVQIGAPVSPPEGDARNQVVDDEVVEDDDARPSPERIDDPAVGVGVVTHVVQGDVRAAESALPSRRHDLDLDPTP